VLLEQAVNSSIVMNLYGVIVKLPFLDILGKIRCHTSGFGGQVDNFWDFAGGEMSD
jgi:hypothetical protein